MLIKDKNVIDQKGEVFDRNYVRIPVL